MRRVDERGLGEGVKGVDWVAIRARRAKVHFIVDVFVLCCMGCRWLYC